MQLAGECNVHDVKIEFLLVSGNPFQSLMINQY